VTPDLFFHPVIGGFTGRQRFGEDAVKRTEFSQPGGVDGGDVCCIRKLSDREVLKTILPPKKKIFKKCSFTV